MRYPEDQMIYRSLDCGGKVTYPSKKQARKTAARSTGNVHPYRCDRCGHWHLTSQQRERTGGRTVVAARERD